MSRWQSIQTRLSQEWAVTWERLRSQLWFQKAYNIWSSWNEKKKTWVLHSLLGLGVSIFFLFAWSRWNEANTLLNQFEEQRLMARALILSQKQIQDSDLSISAQSPEAIKSRINDEIVQPEILPEQLVQFTQDSSNLPASLKIPETFIADKWSLSIKQLTVKQISRILRNLSAIAPSQLYVHSLHISQDSSMKSYLNLEAKILALKYPDGQALLSLSNPETESAPRQRSKGNR